MPQINTLPVDVSSTPDNTSVDKSIATTSTGKENEFAQIIERQMNTEDGGKKQEKNSTEQQAETKTSSTNEKEAKTEPVKTDSVKNSETSKNTEQSSTPLEDKHSATEEKTKHETRQHKDITDIADDTPSKTNDGHADSIDFLNLLSNSEKLLKSSETKSFTAEELKKDNSLTSDSIKLEQSINESFSEVKNQNVEQTEQNKTKKQAQINSNSAQNKSAEEASDENKTAKVMTEHEAITKDVINKEISTSDKSQNNELNSDTHNNEVNGSNKSKEQQAAVTSQSIVNNENNDKVADDKVTSENTSNKQASVGIDNQHAQKQDKQTLQKTDKEQLDSTSENGDKNKNSDKGDISVINQTKTSNTAKEQTINIASSQTPVIDEQASTNIEKDSEKNSDKTAGNSLIAELKAQLETQVNKKSENVKGGNEYTSTSSHDSVSNQSKNSLIVEQNKAENDELAIEEIVTEEYKTTAQVEQKQTSALNFNQAFNNTYNRESSQYQYEANINAQIEALNSKQAADSQTLKANQTQLAETINVNQKDFADNVKNKIMVMINRKIQQADIRLDPPELGNVHVKVSMQNDVAAVSFVVQNPQAKEALEQHMGKLRDMLNDSGVDVGDANVSQQQKNNNEQGDFGDNQQHSQHNGGERQDMIDDTVINQSLVKASALGVDFYA